MSIDRVVSPHAVAPEFNRRRLDRRRLVQGAVAASLAGATGEVSARMTAGSPGEAEHLQAFCQSAASRVSTGGLTAGACLEASLHVMMR
jgi:hypothetical protein